jgi:5-methylcytosine-specific restriction protein B
MGKNIDLEFVKEYKIKPLLKEYFYGNNEKFESIIIDLF